MPIREGVCILVLKVTLILCFVFVVFLLAMRFDAGASINAHLVSVIYLNFYFHPFVCVLEATKMRRTNL